MYEFEKLKKRLKNAARGTTEYRMTIIEANALVKEFETLIQEKQLPPVEAEVPEVVVRTRFLDGGAL